MLDAHPRIHCGPEVKFFRDLYGDYFDDPLQHLRFATTARSLVPEVELLEVLGRAFVELHERAAARAGKVRWADKNPENVLYLEQWQQLLGEPWLLVHVVRNPLDTLASIKEARFPLSIPPDLAARIALYRRYAEAAVSFGMAHSGRYYRVRYEQLVQSPEAALRDLMGWLGEALSPAQLAFNSRPHQAGLEDPKVARTSAVHTDSLNRWPGILTREEARVVWCETRDLWLQIDADAHHSALALAQDLVR